MQTSYVVDLNGCSRHGLQTSVYGGFRSLYSSALRHKGRLSHSFSCHNSDSLWIGKASRFCQWSPISKNPFPGSACTVDLDEADAPSAHHSCTVLHRIVQQDPQYALQAGLIICYAGTGRTASLIAKYRPNVPVLTLVVLPCDCLTESLRLHCRPGSSSAMLAPGAQPA